MDYLWTPWRYRYIADASKDEGCIFCDAVAANDDARTLVVLRGAKNFVILNRYPYTSGHHPEGYNLGMNLGRAAGAGITGHLHLHVLPRWAGDSNFMTVTGETRVEPEELSTTFERLRKALAA
jgi:ATP adenylyltransferase